MYMPIPMPSTRTSSIFESILEEYSSPLEEGLEGNDSYPISITHTKHNEVNISIPTELWFSLD